MSRPTWVGGLGFTYKWNMGWMHDILTYVSKDPVFRRWEHQHLTFSMLYAWNENFVLPFSHDEVVHGKRAMLDKMPGDIWQKRANLRALYGYMYGHPGKKLMFMGCEFAQWGEWNHDESLDWHLLEYPEHRGIQHWVRDRAEQGTNGRLPLAHAVHLLSGRNAAYLGLADRGRIAVGCRADLNLIDPRRLAVGTPKLVRDLPAGGRRFLQVARAQSVLRTDRDVVITEADRVLSGRGMEYNNDTKQFSLRERVRGRYRPAKTNG